MQMHRATAAEPFQSPFDMTLDGFTEGWWGRSRYTSPPNYENLTFEQNGVEVARAEVDTAAQVEDIYEGFTPPLSVVDVSFFEVREGYRLDGLGKKAIALIVGSHRGRTLTAFSEQADGFWSSIGWTRYPRVDGSALYRPLFVKRATQSLVRRIR